MPLSRPSISTLCAIGIAGALIAPAAAQIAPPRTTGDGDRPGGFVTAPMPAPSRPRPAPPPAHAPTSPRLLTEIVGPDDYPMALIQTGAQGRVGFRIRVASDGAPAACEIFETSGYPMLDAHTCALVMQRARFEPARDEQGAPVLSLVRSSVRWVIPAEAKETP